MDLLVICAWCNRVHLDEWVAREQAAPAERVQLSHGICPDCFERVRRPVRRARRRTRRGLGIVPPDLAAA